MIILNIASTISSLLYLAINGSIALSSNRSNFIGFLIVSIPHLGSLLIFSSILLLYSIRLVSTLSQSYGPQFPQLQSDIEIKIKLIIRIIFVACVCICCYLLRIIVFAIAIYDVLYRNTHSSLIFYNTSHVAWYLLIDWIPSLGPVSLYFFLSFFYHLFLFFIFVFNIISRELYFYTLCKLLVSNHHLH